MSAASTVPSSATETIRWSRLVHISDRRSRRLGDEIGDAPRGEGDGALDGGGQPGPVGEVLALDADDDDTVRGGPEDRASRTTRSRPMAWVLARPGARRRPRSTRLTVPAGAPERVASTRTARPAASQRPMRSRGSAMGPMSTAASVAATSRATAGPAPSSRRKSLPIPATTTKGGGGGGACRHERSIETSRKWAAHEMQGSWLRMASSQRRSARHRSARGRTRPPGGGRTRS